MVALQKQSMCSMQSPSKILNIHIMHRDWNTSPNVHTEDKRLWTLKQKSKKSNTEAITVSDFKLYYTDIAI
jgi:hypothetical protein